MPTRRGIEDGVDDTEGQGFKMKSSDGVDDDTDGNAVRGRPAPAVTDAEDTDGNAVKFRGVEAGVEDDDTEGNRRHLRSASDGVDDDDTEGNIVRPGRTIPPSANPNKIVKPRG